ncbi:MAG: hypothetical protein H6508_08295 [Calditrichaeota bacterium]|nr:hypothetical protein [Calditrichota bacterium]
MKLKIILLLALLISGVQIAAAGRPKKENTEGKPDEATTVAVTEAPPAPPRLKYSVSLLQFEMMIPPPESANDPVMDDGMSYEQTLNLLRAMHGKDVQNGGTTPPAAPVVPFCSECEGVKSAIAEHLGKGAVFKIRDGESKTDFTIEGIILNKTHKTQGTDARAKKPGILGTFIPDPSATSAGMNKKEVRMDLTVRLKNTKTGEIRSKQFSGSAEAKDTGINLSGLFNTSSETEVNIATACADAAQKAANWINTVYDEIDAGIEVWADVVRIKQSTAKKDSMVTLNLGRVDGVVPDIEFEVGEPLEVRPDIFIIDEPAAVLQVVEVEDYVCRAKVVSSNMAIDSKTMHATLSKTATTSQ